MPDTSIPFQPMLPPLIIRRSRSNFFFLQDVTGFLVGIGLAVFLTVGGGSLEVGSRITDYLLAGLGLLAAALALWQNLLPAMFDTTPMLKIDEQGIDAQQFGYGLISWSDIAGYEFKTEWAAAGWRKFLYIFPKRPAPDLKFYLIDTRDLDTPAEAIAKAIEQRLRA